MKVYNKGVILLCAVFTNVLKTSASLELAGFINKIRSISSNITIANTQFKPSDYLKYFSGLGNEDLYLNASQLITKYGFRVETHHVTNKQGYKLTLFRIPGTGPPVFLFHGLLLSADDFIIAGPESGMAYLLARDGYDVWMGNARGTKYSRAHQYLDPDKDREYWNFSFTEIGVYDVPAMLDYILEVTKYPKLIYIGHSQGTAAFLVMCIEKPEYNDKIYLMIAMGIVAYVSNMKSPAFRSLALFVDAEYFLYKQLGHPNEILPNTELSRALAAAFCGVYGLAAIICTNIAFIFFGYDYAQLNITNIPNIAQHVPAGASTLQIIHYFQLVNSGNFQQFDYGEAKNMVVYGSKTAPFFELHKVTAPVYIIQADNDWLVDPKDSLKTRSQLSNVREYYRVPFPKFNHLDYLWGLDTKTLVYSKIREILDNNYGSWTASSKK